VLTAEQVRALAWPGESAAAREAAAAVGAAAARNPDRAGDAVYRLLFRHRTLPTAARHLERAGVDLAALTVDGDLYRRLRPYVDLLPALPQRDGRVAVRDVVRALERQRALIEDLAIDLHRREPDQHLVLFGLGIAAAYPAYADRLCHDLDLYVEDEVGGAALLEQVWAGGHFNLGGVRASRLAGRWLTHVTAEGCEDGHRLHVDVLVGGRTAGPGRVPPWLAPPVVERSRIVDLGAGAVRVPSPEDMLLLLAEKVQRGREYDRRACNDARVVLTAEEGRLDAGYLVSIARRAGVRAPLSWLVADAEGAEGRRLLPSSAARRIGSARVERRLMSSLGVDAIDAAGAEGRGSRRRRRVARQSLTWLLVARHARRHAFDRDAMAVWYGVRGRGRQVRADPDVPTDGERLLTTVGLRTSSPPRRTTLPPIARDA
jgi:hypothetical protein